MQKFFLRSFLFIFAVYLLLLSFGCKRDSDSNIIHSTTGAINTQTADGTEISAVRAQIQVPEGTNISLESLNFVTNIDETSVNKNGQASANIARESKQGVVSLGIVQTANGNPLLLKMWVKDSEDSDAISTLTTAEALVLYDPVFLKHSKENFAKIRGELSSSPKLQELADMIKDAIIKDPQDPLNKDKNPQIYAKAVEISDDLLKKYPLPSIKAATKESSNPTDYILVKDDENNNKPEVILVNKTFTHYDVEVIKDKQIFKTTEGRSKHRLLRRKLPGLEWDWPPASLNLTSETKVDIGDGMLEFKFTKLAGLSVFDGLMQLGATIIGIPGATIDELESGYVILSNQGSELLDLINKIIATKPNNKEECAKMLKDLLLGSGKIGLGVVLEFCKEFFKNKIAAYLKDSWLKTITRITASKLVIWASTGYGLTEVVAITYSTAYSPDSYNESGRQKNGKYPDDDFLANLTECKNIHIYFEGVHKFIFSSDPRSEEWRDHTFSFSSSNKNLQVTWSGSNFSLSWSGKHSKTNYDESVTIRGTIDTSTRKLSNFSCVYNYYDNKDNPKEEVTWNFKVSNMTLKSYSPPSEYNANIYITYEASGQNLKNLITVNRGYIWLTKDKKPYNSNFGIFGTYQDTDWTGTIESVQFGKKIIPSLKIQFTKF